MAHITHSEKHRNDRNHAAHHLPEGTVTDKPVDAKKVRRSRRTLVQGKLARWRNGSAADIIDATEDLIFPTEKELDRTNHPDGHRDLKVRKNRVNRMLVRHCEFDMKQSYDAYLAGGASVHTAREKVIHETVGCLRKISSLTEAELQKVARETFDYEINAT